jgi:alkylation response protein AidB-like acyl-CoA dehydrogenase
MVRGLARHFAVSRFPDLKAGLGEEEFPFTLWREACGARLVGPRIPQEYGGAGVSVLASVLIQEEFCRVNPRLGEALSSATLGSDLLVRHGSEEQKERYLRPLVEGRARMGVAGLGKREGLVVEGRGGRMEARGRVELPPGPPPDYLVVRAWVEGLPSLLVLETEGRLSERFLVVEGEVGEGSLLGRKGGEPEMTAELLTLCRVDAAAQALGTAEGAVERALRYLREREETGRPAWEYSRTLTKLAELSAELEASRLLVYRAAWSVDRGRADPLLATMAEWKAGRTAFAAAEEASLLHEGTWGHLEDYRVERFRRFALLHPRFPPFSAQRLTPSRFLSEGLEEVERRLKRGGSRGVP